MAARAVFIDTNVLVYANRAESPFHARAVSALLHAGQRGDSLWFSRQILRDFLAVLTRPQAGLSVLAATAAVEDARSLLSKFNLVEDGPGVTEELFRLLEQHRCGGKQIHDANILATMLAHGFRHLLTFNVADFRRFGGLIDLVAP